MRVHEFAFSSLQGASMPLDRWTGQPLLLVNTASECGFTPQYAKLQALVGGIQARRPCRPGNSLQ